MLFFIFAVIIALCVSLYLLMDSEIVKVVCLIVLAVTIFSGFGFLYWHHSGKLMNFKGMLSKAETLLNEGSEEVKDVYLQIYNTYLKLPERHKPNVYTKVIHLREKITAQLKTEKHIKEHLDKAVTGSLDEQKDHYRKLHAHYQKLPTKVQKKYYPHLVHLKDKLERGK